MHLVSGIVEGLEASFQKHRMAIESKIYIHIHLNKL